MFNNLLYTPVEIRIHVLEADPVTTVPRLEGCVQNRLMMVVFFGGPLEENSGLITDGHLSIRPTVVHALF
jgi:hypothetical protein